MDHVDRPMTRERLLRRGAAGVLGLAAGGSLAERALAVELGGVTLNWLTWNDHYFPSQLSKVKAKTQIAGRPSLISDDADAYIKVKRGGARWDISSEDALWVPKFYKEGLIEPFDLSEIAASKQLYSVARQVPFWKAGSKQMGYPFGWSSLPRIGTSNFVLERGEKSPDEIVRGTKRGLLVTAMLGSGANVVTGEYSRGATPLLNGAIRIDATSGIGGIATSGARGRSFSLGIADAVTTLARDAATADAAATLVANAVNVDSPAIRRRPARELDPDSDLRDLPVTVAVAPLDPAEIDMALGREELYE